MIDQVCLARIRRITRQGRPRDFAPGLAPIATATQHHIDLGDYLESLFGRRVDLVTIESLSPYIGPHILREVQYAQIAA